MAAGRMAGGRDESGDTQTVQQQLDSHAAGSYGDTPAEYIITLQAQAE